MKQIEIRLRGTDPSQRGKFLSLFFEPAPTEIGSAWFEAFNECISKNLILEKSYNFVGFPAHRRSFAVMIQELKENIAIINGYNWPESINIRNDFGESLTQDDLNYLHHWFELLIGQVWDVSNYYKIASYDVRQAIRKLNNLIHEYEGMARVANCPDHSRDPKSAIQLAFIHCDRFSLSDVPHRFETDFQFGDVTLHYSQLGKTHFEAFNDNDQHIDHKNINGLRYFTGCFTFEIKRDSSFLGHPENSKRFDQWLEAQGLKPDYQALGVGWVKIARLTKVSTLDAIEPGLVFEQLSLFLDIHQIIVTVDNRVISAQTYAYNDVESDQLILEFYKPKLEKMSESLIPNKNKLLVSASRLKKKLFPSLEK